MKRTTKKTGWVLTLVMTVLLSACGGGGGGSGGDNQASTAQPGNQWDSMKWDEGRWN